MSPITRLNTVSKEYTGNTIFPPDKHRGFFFLVLTGTSGTVEFGQGGGKLPLAAGDHYAPNVAPIGEISVETAGTFIVHMG